MIMYVESSLFDSPAQVLVNPVNTVGVMGKGRRFNSSNDIRKCLPIINTFVTVGRWQLENFIYTKHQESGF